MFMGSVPAKRAKSLKKYSIFFFRPRPTPFNPGIDSGSETAALRVRVRCASIWTRVDLHARQDRKKT